MELMQLEMFIAVVEEGTVRGAAERVFRTQPAVSIAVRKLENEIGTPLLRYGASRKRCMTCAGRTLYQYASRIIAMRNEALLLFSVQRDSYLRVNAPKASLSWEPDTKMPSHDPASPFSQEAIVQG